MYFRNHDMTALKSLLVLGIIQAAYALTEKDLCEILPDKTAFRHSSICSKYYTCIGKKAVEGTCLDGLYFDKDIGKCNDQKKVKCDADLNAKCTSNSVYLADPESCSNYYLCINGKAKRVSCPKGSHFDSDSSSCAQDKSFKCKITTEYDICSVIPKQTLFKHDEDCKKYRACSDNKIVERNCPGSLWFNSVNGKCDTESNAKCGDDPIADPARPENYEICGTPSRPYVGLVADGITCRGFYDCAVKYDVNGKQILNAQPEYKKCGKNEIFNEKEKDCVERLNAKCAFDRCDGWGNDYVNIDGDGCRGYAMCEKNKEVMRLTCPDKYYFDEKQQDCVTKVIKYHSCSKN